MRLFTGVLPWNLAHRVLVLATSGSPLLQAEHVQRRVLDQGDSVRECVVARPTDTGVCGRP